MKTTMILIAIEIIGVIGFVVFGILWLLNPDGNWEPPFAICTGMGLITALARRYYKSKPQGRFESNAERIRHREKLRQVFEAEIHNCRAKKLRQDVIVRHIERVDNYPETSDEEGISPWFRIWLLDTYTRGIVLGLQRGGLIKCEKGYRFADWVNGEKADVSACLIGDIPYDSIVEVNMDGDPYYHFPHIYCHFDFNGEPYERLWFCIEHEQPHGQPYYEHLADYKDVVANNPTDVMSFA